MFLLNYWLQDYQISSVHLVGVVLFIITAAIIVRLYCNSKVFLINNLSDCDKVCRKLRTEKILAFDIEGVNLSRTGEICIIQISCSDGRVYIFDICALKQEAFTIDRLRGILESEAIMKMIYDCRSDCDALNHQYNIIPSNIFDLQVLYVLQQCPKVKYLPGMKRVLEDTLSTKESKISSKIKSTGLALFAPEHGGSYEVWRNRPLPPSLLAYAAQDVQKLFTIYNVYTKDMKPELFLKISKISMKRMKRTIRRQEEWPRGFKSPWAKKDF